MLTQLLGNKIGMSQLFDEKRRAVPVTVINVSDWLVTQVKVQERDGYSALQLGKLKKKYKTLDFSTDWLSKKKEIFSDLKEVKIDQSKEADYSVGQKVSDLFGLEKGDQIMVSGISRGLGFQGVMKRYDFGGGPGGHGSTFHRAPGSVGNMRRQGKVLKGKKLPGHCGARRITVKGLEVVSLDKEKGYLFIKGSIPGKKNSLIHIKKQG